MAEPIEALLKRHEDKTLEFKLNLASPDRVMATLVAFANSAGGTLVIGVEDRTRAVVGLSDPTGVEERLANFVADRIAPSLLVEISVAPWRATYLVVAEVFPSQRRPHFVRSLGTEAGTYIRIGSSNRVADEALRAELARGMSTTFDETAIEGSAALLDRAYARMVLGRKRPLSDPDLVALRALDRSPSGLRATVGGYLLFRKQTEPTLMPDAWVHAGRFTGTDRKDIADSKRIDGRLFELVDQSLEFLDRSLDAAITIAGATPQHQIVRPLPSAALREAVVNAVVHADYRQQGGPIRVAVYRDRVEIENPGHLLPGLTIDDLFAGTSRLRNRMIGRVFAERGYIEQWGSGVRRMVQACRDAALPDPTIQELPGRVRVTFDMARIGAPDLTPREAQVLQVISAEVGISTAELAAAIGVTDRTARTLLARLVAKGVVVVIGSSPTDPQRRFYRSDRESSSRTRA
jgi:ATP-dependent DNA helicase RecG